MKTEEYDFMRTIKKITSIIVTALLLILAGVIYLSFYYIYTGYLTDIKQYLTVGAVILLLMFITTAVIYLRIYLLKTFSHLYKGVDDIGLSFFSFARDSSENKSFLKLKQNSVASEIDEMFEEIKKIISLR